MSFDGTVRANAPEFRLGGEAGVIPRPRKSASPFRYFDSSAEVIRLARMMYVSFPPSLRDVKGLLFERGIHSLWVQCLRRMRFNTTC